MASQGIKEKNSLESSKGELWSEGKPSAKSDREGAVGLWQARHTPERGRIACRLVECEKTPDDESGRASVKEKSARPGGPSATSMSATKRIKDRPMGGADRKKESKK